MSVPGKNLRNGTYEFDYNRTPEVKTRWEAFRDSIHNPADGTYCGHPPKKWVLTGIFYTIFFSVLAIFFAICMKGLLATIDDDKPKWTLSESLIGTNPGLGFRPISENTDERSLIWYSSSDPASVQKWTCLLDTFLAEYINSSLLPNGGRNQQICDYNTPVKPGHVCAVEVNNWGPCSPTERYGFNNSAPCVFIKLNRGFTRKLTARCTSCEEISGQTYTSPRISTEEGTKRPPFLINRKMVDAFVSVGAGYAAMERFGMETGISVLSSTAWKTHLEKIQAINKEFKESVLQKSCQVVRNVHTVDEGEVLDTQVSFDGSWHKRGHTSLHGIAFVIDIMTGLVVDYEVMSKYCHMCAIRTTEFEADSPEFLEWKKVHVEIGECQIYGWEPHYYNDTKDLPSDMPESLVAHIKSLNSSRLNSVWVSCKGEDPHDHESIGELKYYPDSQGFPGYYYPYTNTPGYLSPIVAVHFLRPARNRIINVECRAWAKNIKYKRKRNERSGSIHFELMIDE